MQETSLRWGVNISHLQTVVKPALFNHFPYAVVPLWRTPECVSQVRAAGERITACSRLLAVPRSRSVLDLEDRKKFWFTVLLLGMRKASSCIKKANTLVAHQP